jgi:hypothetical protein
VTAIQNYHSGRYRVRRHVSFLDVSCHGHYYNNPNSYYHGVDSGYVYQDWLFEPAPFHYSYGYNCIGGYPYYVHNGYKHRYSSVDMCNYELLDLEATNPVKTFYNIACNIAFDQCAAKRDQLNDKEDMQKYVCVEKVGSDYANKENKDRIPSMINKLDKTAVQKIEAFLNEHTPQALFKKGLKGIEKCKIIKSNRSKNKQSCNFYVEVNGNTYPLTNKSVCSNAKKTPLKYYGCQSSSQKKNAACLLSIAVAEGYCN